MFILGKLSGKYIITNEYLRRYMENNGFIVITIRKDGNYFVYNDKSSSFVEKLPFAIRFLSSYEIKEINE